MRLLFFCVSRNYRIIRRMMEGTVFSLFVSLHIERGSGGTPSKVGGVGYPIPGLDRGVPHPRSGQGEGVSHPRSGQGEGVSHPRSGQGVTPSQVWMAGTPLARSGWCGATPSQVWMVGGYPIPGLGGTPSQVWTGGTPQPGLDGGGVAHPRSG